jgi:hypothetical protein
MKQAFGQFYATLHSARECPHPFFRGIGKSTRARIAATRSFGSTAQSVFLPQVFYASFGVDALR